MKGLLVAVMGPTASGKTDLAETLANELNARLINADGFQVYRHLDIGTAKPDYRARYRLLDILDPNEGFGVGAWVRMAGQILKDAPEGRFIVVGGSGLNIRALFEGYEEMAGPPPEGLREALNLRDLADLAEELQRRAPEEAAEIDLKNPVRVRRALERLESPKEPLSIDLSSFDKYKVGLDGDPLWINTRIEKRVHSMIELGWLEEVSQLQEKGYKYDDPGIKAHGYRNLWDVLEGRKTRDTAVQEIVTMVRQYAKRQRTWMRTEPNLCKINGESGRRAAAEALAYIQAGGFDGKID